MAQQTAQGAATQTTQGNPQTVSGTSLTSAGSVSRNLIVVQMKVHECNGQNCHFQHCNFILDTQTGQHPASGSHTHAASVSKHLR